MSARDGVDIVEEIIEKNLAILSELTYRELVQSMDWELQREGLSKDVERLGFLDIGIVGLDGTARYVLTDETAQLGDRDYIQKAMGGEASIIKAYNSSSGYPSKIILL